MTFIVIFDFNSIKVRLEQRQERLCQCRPTRFQFHKGTIRTEPMYDAALGVAYFNSIKVRLELTRCSAISK